MANSVVWLTPCFQSAHLIPRFIESLNKLDPQPDRYVFSENNSIDDTLEMLVSAPLGPPHEVLRVWFAKDAVKRTGRYTPMAHIMQLLLTRARQLDPDFAIISACDVFVRTPDAVEILTAWNVDCIAARIVRWFPGGLFISAKWAHPYRKDLYRMARLWKQPFDDTPLMVGFGLVCLSRRLIQDRRINFYPIPPSPIPGDQCSEDFGYCMQMRKYEYKCCLDGIVSADHVVYDEKHQVKAWTKDEEFEYP